MSQSQNYGYSLWIWWSISIDSWWGVCLPPILCLKISDSKLRTIFNLSQIKNNSQFTVRPCTSTASESEFDHIEFCAWKIGKLVSRLSKCQDELPLPILQSLHRLLCCCKTDSETDCTTFLSLDTQNLERTLMHPKLCQKLCPKLLACFNCFYLFTWWRLKFCIYI